MTAGTVTFSVWSMSHLLTLRRRGLFITRVRVRHIFAVTDDAAVKVTIVTQHENSKKPITLDWIRIKDQDPFIIMVRLVVSCSFHEQTSVHSYLRHTECTVRILCVCVWMTYCYALVPPLHFPWPWPERQRQKPAPTRRCSPPEDMMTRCPIAYSIYFLSINSEWDASFVCTSQRRVNSHLFNSRNLFIQLSLYISIQFIFVHISYQLLQCEWNAAWIHWPCLNVLILDDLSFLLLMCKKWVK